MQTIESVNVQEPHSQAEYNVSIDIFEKEDTVLNTNQENETTEINTPIIETLSRKETLCSKLKNKKKRANRLFYKKLTEHFSFTATKSEMETKNAMYKEKIDFDINLINKITEYHEDSKITFAEYVNTIENLEEMRLQQTIAFGKNMKALLEKYDSLDSNINSENIKEEVSEMNKEGYLIYAEIDDVKKRIDVVKKLIDNSNIDVFVNIEELAKIAKTETEMTYGNVNSKRRTVNDITAHIKLLKKKIG